MRLKKLCSPLVVLALSASAAHAITIDFDSLAVGTDIRGAGTVNSDVTFSSASDLLVTNSDPSGSGSLTILPSVPRDAIRADFNIPVGGVSVELGDFNGDSETVFLEAYDSSNTLIALDSEFLSAAFVGMEALSVSSANIAYVIVRSGGVFPNSVFMNNFTYTAPIAGPGVPDGGSSLLLLSLSYLGLAAGRKLRK